LSAARLAISLVVLFMCGGLFCSATSLAQVRVERIKGNTVPFQFANGSWILSISNTGTFSHRLSRIDGKKVDEYRRDTDGWEYARVGEQWFRFDRRWIPDVSTAGEKRIEWIVQNMKMGATLQKNGKFQVQALAIREKEEGPWLPVRAQWRTKPRPKRMEACGCGPG
jgi:hypothetical protein